MNKFTYDGVSDTLSIILSKKQIAYAEEHGTVIVNFDDKDKPTEIEILNSSKFMGDLLAAILKAKNRLNSNRNYCIAFILESRLTS